MKMESVPLSAQEKKQVVLCFVLLLFALVAWIVFLMVCIFSKSEFFDVYSHLFVLFLSGYNLLVAFPAAIMVFVLYRRAGKNKNSTMNQSEEPANEEE